MGKRAHGEGTIYQRPDGRWAAAITIGFEAGRQKRKFVYGKTQSQVRDKLRKLREQQATGTLPAPNRRTLSEYLDSWLAMNRHRWAERTFEMYSFEAEKYVKPHLGSKGLGKVTPEQVADLQATIADLHGKRTAEKTRALLHRVFSQAHAMHLIPNNPVSGVPAIKTFRSEVEPVPIEDLRKFLVACQGTRWYALFHLVLVAGLRRGEVLGLTWDDVTPKRIIIRGTLKVVNNKAKVTANGKSKNAARRFPIATATWDVLCQHRRLQDEERAAIPSWVEHRLLFPNTQGKPLNPHNLYHRVLYPMQKQAKVKRFTLHQLRHTYGSLMIRQGANPKVLSVRMGHASAAFTMNEYVHEFAEERDQLAFGLEELLG